MKAPEISVCTRPSPLTNEQCYPGRNSRNTRFVAGKPLLNGARTLIWNSDEIRLLRMCPLFDRRLRARARQIAGLYTKQRAFRISKTWPFMPVRRDKHTFDAVKIRSLEIQFRAKSYGPDYKLWSRITVVKWQILTTWIVSPSWQAVSRSAG